MNEKRCSICGKILNDAGGKGLDCGGDCAECMEPIEREIGDMETANKLKKEIGNDEMLFFKEQKPDGVQFEEQ